MVAAHSSPGEGSQTRAVTDGLRGGANTTEPRRPVTPTLQKARGSVTLAPLEGAGLAGVHGNGGPSVVLFEHWG
jgi:hypothetical protein